MTLFLFGLFFVLLLVELPVAFAIGVSSSVAVLLSERLPPTFIVSKIFAGLDSFPLMAIPSTSSPATSCRRAGSRRRS